MNNRNMALQSWSPQILSVLRIVAALLFLQHGCAKLFHVPYQAMFAHLPLMSLLGIQGVIELVGGGLLTIGLFSRPVAFILWRYGGCVLQSAFPEDLVAHPQRR